MRLIMQIAFPTKEENSVVGMPDFENAVTRVYLAAGAQSAYSDIVDGRRTDVIVVEIDDLGELTPKAKLVFDFLKVRPTFLPEAVAKDHFGH
jgi:hypothetical protein